jgi:Ca2+-binding RTX toxin-like protein
VILIAFAILLSIQLSIAQTKLTTLSTAMVAVQLCLGTAENDAFYGSPNPNIFDAGLGDDNLYGGEGNHILYGNRGNDFIDGNKGDDILFGGKNNDIILGGEGEDRSSAIAAMIQ